MWAEAVLRDPRHVNRTVSAHSARWPRSLQVTPAEPPGPGPLSPGGRFSVAPHRVCFRRRASRSCTSRPQALDGGAGGSGWGPAAAPQPRTTRAGGDASRLLQPTAAAQGPEPFDFRGNRPSLPPRTPLQAGRAPGFYSAKAAGWLRLSIWEGLGFSVSRTGQRGRGPAPPERSGTCRTEPGAGRGGKNAPRDRAADRPPASSSCGET